MDKNFNSVLAVVIVYLFSCAVLVYGQNFPKCARESVNLNVSEAEPIDFFVYDLNCTDPDGDELIYNLYKGNTYAKFKVGSDGIVRLAKTLNADFVFKFKLFISVTENTPAALSVEVVVAIFSLNINDNSPRISSLPSVINVNETTPIGTKLASCVVKDRDEKNGGLPGQTRVGILDPGATGSSRRWVIDSKTCDIYLNYKPDYEKINSYQIGVVAYDLDPVVPRSVTQSVTINVLDSNDNYPACKGRYRLVTVSEDQALNAAIYTLNCTDEDSGASGVVHYKLSDKNSDLVKSSFSVQSTGEVHVVALLDYEDVSFHEVSIDVYDGGLPSLMTTVIIGVVVEDVDDNKPTWTVNPMTKTVEETSALGTVLFSVSAEDRDEPNTAASTVTYGIHRNANPDWFGINAETGAIYVKRLMNWIDAPWLDMEVFAYSSDRVNEKSIATVNISIIDQNNVAPRFVQVFYQGNVSEDAAIDTPIITVKAIDPENGLNGEVVYSLNSPFFKVDPTTGNITLKQKVDFETKSVYSLNIEAHDRGTHRETGYAFILINVLPVNEFDPVLDPPVQVLSKTIPEDTEPGTILFNFTASDDDKGVDGEVSFLLVNLNTPFAIEEKTGVFRVASALDRETVPVWNITLLLRDESPTPRSTTANIIITLEDINDNNPICEPLTNIAVSLARVPSNTIATIKCTDADEGINAEFTYLKIAGDSNTDETFTVDENNGNIVLAKEPKQTVYVLTIFVEDKGNPKRDVTVAFNIIAELQFNFTSNLPIALTFSEDAALASEIFDVDACCVVGSKRFEFLAGNENGVLFMDAESGKIVLQKKFDREKMDFYNFTVRAISLDTNTTVDSYITIDVEDVNDVKPKFDTSFDYVKISENSNFPTKIKTYTAVDSDLGLNAEVVYDLLVDGSGVGGFYVDQSGSLWLNSSLDAEKTSQYSLTIRATDKGNIPLTGSTTIFIQVQDVNDFQPQILNINGGIVSKNVSEDAALGGPIFNIQVEDKDIDTVFTFTITQGNDDGMFVIDSSTGTIYLVRLLDRETVDQYNLTVEVKTSANEIVSAQVSINVLDVNDREPKFKSDFYDVKIAHEDPAGKVLMDFTGEITDDDLGVNKNILSLEISDGDPDNRFEINGLKLQTKEVVDYRYGTTLSLTLNATDSGNPSRSGFTRIDIEVTPKYSPPMFALDMHNLSMKEDLSLGSVIFDADATVNGSTEGIGGTLSYRITNPQAASQFQISSTDGRVSLVDRLDYESAKTVTLIVEAKSTEDSSLVASSTVVITIENINDNIPTFTNTIYNFTIDETIGTGTSVGQVSANDLDNDAIQYSIANAPGSSDFNIDVNTGEITVANNLDFLRQRSYNLPIVADDGGSRKGEARVVINLNDVNNHPPTFTPGSFQTGVLESINANTVFYTAVAEDKDTGINGQIKYSLDQPNPQFTINPDTGALSVTAALDRETVDRHNLVIRATDQASSGSLSGMLTLTVIVLDVNDNAPTFSKSTVTEIINKSAVEGTEVYTATAVDLDSGENGMIEYEITNGNGENLFDIVSSTGQIITKSNLQSASPEYVLTITAKDRGLPHKSATMQLTIQVTASFVGEVVLTVSENLPNDVSAVGNVTVTSPGATYTITGGNEQDHFQVNSNTGVISTKQKLDRETTQSYRLIVMISDNAGSSLTRVARINVQDSNDNAPTISTLDTNIKVVENTPNGQIVARFTATDADEGINAETTFSISDTPAIAKLYFEMDGDLLKTKQPLDFEVIKDMDLTVVATDKGAVPMSTAISVRVTVIDVSDTAPDSSPSSAASLYFTTETSSKSAAGELVRKLGSDDLNINSTSGSVEFINVNDGDVFSIDKSGRITVQKPDLLAPEEKYLFWFAASVTSNGNNTHRLGLVRIDTFNPDLHLVSLDSVLSVADLENERNDVTTIIENDFFPNVAKIWKIKGYSETFRRRLLAEQNSQALVYVMMDPVPYTIADYQKTKYFMASSDIKSALDADQRLSAYTVRDSTATTTSEPSFVETTEFLIFIILLIILLLILLLILLIYCCYKKKKRDQKRVRGSSENLIPEERTTRSTGGRVDTSILPDLSDESNKSKSRSNARDMLPPVQTINAGFESHYDPFGKTPKKSKLKPIQHKGLPVPQPQSERQPSTIDLSQIDTVGGQLQGNVNPPVVPKQQVPVIATGRYDGFGVDTNTNQRYAYNTRTGSTLYHIPRSEQGQGGSNKKKKEPTPLLVVRKEREYDFTPNMTRSVKMTSASNSDWRL